MGRCKECNIDTGWGNGNLCKKHLEEFWENHNFKYGDLVKVENGFFLGQQGRIISNKGSRYWDGENYARYFIVKFENNETHEFTEYEIIKIKSL
jgi:hypothetical protein